MIERRDHLRSYLFALAGDLVAARRFRGSETDVVAAVVQAVLNGGIAAVKEIRDDLIAVATDARPLAEAAVGAVASRYASDLASRGLDVVVDVLTGRKQDRAEREKVGKEFRDLAEKIRTRR